MRDLLTGPAAQFRVHPQTRRTCPDGAGYHPDEVRGNGYFLIPAGIKAGGYVTGGVLAVIASDGGSWDHVSLSCRNRVPHYREVMAVHRLFFRDDEVTFQLQVPPSDHVSIHPYTLHLWRPHDAAIPMPPRLFV